MLRLMNATRCRLLNCTAAFKYWLGTPLQPQLALVGIESSAATRRPAGGLSLGELISGLWHMGVPKSRVSPSRKRMKHWRFIPDKVGWYKCEKCGEPKRPHRICSDHVEVCALTKEQWLNSKSSKSTDVTIS